MGTYVDLLWEPLSEITMYSQISAQRVVVSVALVCAVGLLTSCIHVVSPGRGYGAPADVRRAEHGPPPHAPAHGYRHKLHGRGGARVAFDSGIGVYVVVGHTDLFFWNDYFYRWHDGGWQTSARRNGGWASIGSGKLPGRLARKHAGKRRGHSPKHHPAKRGH